MKNWKNATLTKKAKVIIFKDRQELIIIDYLEK